MGPRTAATLCCLIAGPALADFDPSAYPPYETCALCHGLNGVSHIGKFPNLAGQKPQYIRHQIEAFLSGDRNNDGGQMASIVTELDPGAIDVVVTWFAGQAPPTPYAGAEAGAAQFGALGCDACHSNTPDQDDEVPYLSAQHATYLEKQMTDFRDGQRAGEPTHRLHAALLSAPQVDPAQIAAYLAGVARP